MSLSFRNLTNFTVFVCIINRAHVGTCPEGYIKKGWFRVPPGETHRVYVGSARRVQSFYAENNFGNVWGGNFPFTDIPNTRFEWCLNRTCSPCRRLGFDVIASLAEELIIELTLGSNRRKSKSGNIRKVFPINRKLKSGVNRMILRMRLEGRKRTM